MASEMIEKSEHLQESAEDLVRSCLARHGRSIPAEVVTAQAAKIVASLPHPLRAIDRR